MQRLSPEKSRQIAKAFTAYPQGFSVRVAGPEDARALVALGAAVFAYNPPTLREMRYALTRGHGAVFVMEDGAALAGYIALEVSLRHSSLYLNTVAVDQRFRGRGLGQALYALGDDVAAGIGARAMMCHVRPDNALNIGILEKNGFLRQRVEEQYYDDGTSAYAYRKSYH